jgi:hypothetical protein
MTDEDYKILLDYLKANPTSVRKTLRAHYKKQGISFLEGFYNYWYKPIASSVITNSLKGADAAIEEYITLCFKKIRRINKIKNRIIQSKNWVFRNDSANLKWIVTLILALTGLIIAIYKS